MYVEVMKWPYSDIYCLYGKHMEVFRALMEAGGDVDTPDSSGQTALHDRL
jgi:ankyrin repeat protein